MPKGVYDRQKGKRKGPLRASANHKVVTMNHRGKAVNTLGSLAKMDEVAPKVYAANEAPVGYITTEVYEDTLERFHLLSCELAERDVEIARLMLELAQQKANALRRLKG